jgi:magnesium-transporting ATPase (P-type)
LIEFDSDRKRMSVLLRTGEGELMVFVKGADTSIARLLAPDQKF